MTTNATANGTVPTVPKSGQPTTLLEVVQHEALAYRAWATPEGDFLADQLDRVAQLILWAKATTPEEFADRLDVLDDEARAAWFDRGYSEGYDACRRELGFYRPH